MSAFSVFAGFRWLTGREARGDFRTAAEIPHARSSDSGSAGCERDGASDILSRDAGRHRSNRRRRGADSLVAAEAAKGGGIRDSRGGHGSEARQAVVSLLPKRPSPPEVTTEFWILCAWARRTCRWVTDIAQPAAKAALQRSRVPQTEAVRRESHRRRVRVPHREGDVGKDSGDSSLFVRYHVSGSRFSRLTISGSVVRRRRTASHPSLRRAWSIAMG